MQNLASKIIIILRRVKEEPRYCLILAVAIMRGVFYRFYYRMLNSNVHIGFPFKAFTKVRISGKGAVYIGNNCSVSKNIFKGLSIVTLSPDAKVIIGNNCSLQGLTIRCKNIIEIGDETMTALSLIQDISVVDLKLQRGRVNRSNGSKSKSIQIGKNVWLGAESCVLEGCDIGDNSVLAAGAMCHDFHSKACSLVIGNPAKRPLPISNILKLKVKK